MIRINLLAEGKRPAAVRKARKPATSFLEGENIALWLLLATVLLVGVLPSAVWWWMKSSEVESNRQQIAAAQREVDELAAIIKEVEEYKAKQAELEHKIAVINDLRRNQRGPVQVMDAISRALPELLWIDRMSMNASQISLSGRAFNPNAIAAFGENLDQVPEFQEPILQDMRAQGEVYTYSLVFNYSFRLPSEEEEPVAETAGG